MNRLLRVLIILSIVLALLTLGLVGGVLLDRAVLSAIAPPGGIPAGAASEFRLMGNAWNVVHQVYVDRIALDPRRLAYGAIGGMVDALGDTGHSRFLTPQMVEQQHSFTAGEFEGIGAYVEMRDGHVVIVAPMDNSPAQRAGLRPGDVILKVNGESIVGLPLDEVLARILGPAGTTLTLSILDPRTGSMRDVTLERVKITVDNVTWERLPSTTIAHVRITAFSKGAAPDVAVELPSDVDALIPLTERDLTLQQLRDSGDTQLLRALELLGQPVDVQSP